jgi:hypothetical protein
MDHVIAFSISVLSEGSLPERAFPPQLSPVVTGVRVGFIWLSIHGLGLIN